MTVELHDLAAAYALDAMPADETTQFEVHLADCEACRTEVDEMQATASLLGEATAQAPPAGLRASVLEATNDVRQLPPVLSAERARPLGEPPVSRPRSRWRRAVLSAAAAVLLVVSGALGVRVADLSDRTEKAEQTNQALAEVLSADDARTLHADITEGGEGTVVTSTKQGSAVLITRGAAAAPEGRTYQAWLVEPDGPRSAGLVDPGADGKVTQALDGDVRSAEAVAMTVEPAGGSEQPTTDPVLTVPLRG